jgi:DNA repair exonuclease SbcCD ATPase subunit
MIHFTKVRWKNFLSTGNAFTEIKLNENDSTLIVGENGAGKSTMLDALCFGLYGKPFRKVKKDQLINSVNGRDVLVEIEFSTHDHQYLIRRGIKPNIFEIIEDGVLIDQDAAARDYQEMLEKHILKLSMKSFTQIVILGSSSFVPFMQLTTNVRREVIEDLLDIRVFSSMALLLKDRVATNREEYKLNEQDILYTQEGIKAQEKLRTELDEKRAEKIEDFQKRIKQAQENIAREEALAAVLGSTIEELMDGLGDRDAVNARVQKILALEKSLESKKANARKTIKFYTENDECPTCTQHIDQAIKREKLDEKEKAIEEVEAALEKLSDELAKTERTLAEISDLQRHISSKQSELSTKQNNIKVYQKEISVYNKEIDSLNKTESTYTEDAITTLRSDLGNFLSVKERVLRDKEMFELATVILRDSGIKSRIIKQYIPVINTLVNKYLAAMDFFVKFELNESFEERILSRHRDDFTYDSFSEGEKMRIDLALLFTWRSIARMKNSVSTNLLILDEVFDASLDANGCDEFLKLIHNLEDTNIFVISHKGDVLHDKFSNILRFTKQKNFSRIVS